MVKRFGPDRDVNEPMISLESEVGREIQELAALYVNSAQQFLERLQSLVLSLDAQIQECVSFHGPYEFNPYQPIRTNLATFRWSPSKDFDYPAFANLASKTFEAWYIARQRNSDVGAFNGATLQALVGLFNGIVNRPSLDAGPTAVSKIPTLFFEFQSEVVRLNGLLCLNFPKEETPSQESSPLGSAALPEVADSVETTVSTPAFKLEQHSDRETEWCSLYFTVSELTQMRKNVKLPHSRTQMTREISKEIENGRIRRQGNQPMRLRMDLYKEWSTHGNE